MNSMMKILNIIIVRLAGRLGLNIQALILVGIWVVQLMGLGNMSDYFKHEFISASDLKSFIVKTGGGHEEPANLQAIYDMGTLFHAAILEPYKIYQVEGGYMIKGCEGLLTDADYRLVMGMRDTFFKDDFCRMIISRSDFQREKEFYNTVQVGGMEYQARCKADGSCEGIGLVIELKGLKLLTQKAFELAIERLHYDLSAAHYLLTAKAKVIPIIGISKIDPMMMFKKIVRQFDETYAVGEEKLKTVLRAWHDISPEDIKMVA